MNDEMFDKYYREFLLLYGKTDPSLMAARTALQMIQVSQYRIKHGSPIGDFLDETMPQSKIPVLKALYQAYERKETPVNELLAKLDLFIYGYVRYMVSLGFPEAMITATGMADLMDKSPEEMREISAVKS